MPDEMSVSLASAEKGDHPVRSDSARRRQRREPLLKPDDVATVFNVATRTVIIWAKSGRLPFVPTPGGQYRFRPADVDAMVNAPVEVA
ncbi:helix-turn-helix domain-containing protein [Actinomadura sp. ATCC 39365]